MTTPHPEDPAEGPDDPEVTGEPDQDPPPSEDPVRPDSDPVS